MGFFGKRRAGAAVPAHLQFNLCAAMYNRFGRELCLEQNSVEMTKNTVHGRSVLGSTIGGQGV